ncbi:MAG: nucleotidyltransferase domain-containing protein [Blastocatellia bacterium]
MSKRTASVKSPINPVKTTATAAGRRSRPIKTVDKEPPKLVDLSEAFRVWRESFETPAKRRTYIEDVCRRIAEEFKPEKIILFGSHAYGKPTPESDLDLLVVMPYEGSYFQQAMIIRRRLGLVTPMDLLVLTSEDLRYRLDIGDRFMREIVERGKVMYEATHA